MRDGLVMNLDLPGAVVGDHDQDRRLVTHGGVNLDGVEPEGAVTGRNRTATLWSDVRRLIRNAGLDAGIRQAGRRTLNRYLPSRRQT